MQLTLGRRSLSTSQHDLELGRHLLTIGVPLALVIGMVVPLAWLIGNSFNIALPSQAPNYGLDNWLRAFSQPRAIESLVNTFSLGAVRVALSFPIAVAFVWLITRTDMPWRGAIETICWLGVFVPT